MLFKHRELFLAALSSDKKMRDFLNDTKGRTNAIVGKHILSPEITSIMGTDSDMGFIIDSIGYIQEVTHTGVIEYTYNNEKFLPKDSVGYTYSMYRNSENMIRQMRGAPITEVVVALASIKNALHENWDIDVDGDIFVGATTKQGYSLCADGKWFGALADMGTKSAKIAVTWSKGSEALKRHFMNSYQLAYSDRDIALDLQFETMEIISKFIFEMEGRNAFDYPGEIHRLLVSITTLFINEQVEECELALTGVSQMFHEPFRPYYSIDGIIRGFHYGDNS